MKILHLSTCDLLGGAARAAFRLHEGLLASGLDSRMLVQIKDSRRSDVIGPESLPGKVSAKVRHRLDHLVLKRYPNRVGAFSPAMVPSRMAGVIDQLDPDIVHLHWVGRGFLRPELLPRLGRPLIWTMHDQWPFTGGCHFSAECRRYVASCGACPVLGSDAEGDLSRRLWRRKKSSYGQVDLVAVAVGSWLADCARDSSLLRGVPVQVIANGLDTDRFKPRPRHEARARLGLPANRALIAFGALDAVGDTRKGFDLLVKALGQLSRESLDAEVVVFGANPPAHPPDLGFRATYLGHIDDEDRLIDVYSAADVMVVPSRQESFGQTASEAMACGAPVVAFGATGLLDIVEHERTGYLARPFEPADLARGIAWVLSDRERGQALAKAARIRAEREFALPLMARRYSELYRQRLKRG